MAMSGDRFALVARLRAALSRCRRILAVLLPALLVSPPALAYPAHYFVVNEATDGTLSVVSHQLVEISGSPDLAYEPPQPGRLERNLDASVHEKSTGRKMFAIPAGSSPWLRGEFHDGSRIDGQSIAAANMQYVLRFPLGAGHYLRLRSAGEAAREPTSGPVTRSAQSGAAARPAAQALEIDLDAHSSPARVAAPPPQLPAGYASGSVLANGDPSNRLDLLIVAEGYTADQQSQFVLDATNLVNKFLSISPYRDFKHLTNAVWLFVPSSQSGASKPNCAETPTQPVVSVATAFSVQFCSLGLRRLVTVDTAKVLTAAAAVPDWDKVIVLVNDSEYGGSGGSVGVVTTHAQSMQIQQHEFGHSFTQLADEYTSAYPGYPPCSDLPATSARCEANVTDQSSRALIKWTRWLAAQTPVPSDAQLAGDPLGAGLWLGARFQSAGMYRQCYNGIMRTLGGPFCRVDSEAFVKRLYGGGWGVPAQGVSLIEPGAIPASTSVDAAPQSTLQFQANIAGSLAAGGLKVSWLVDGAPAQMESSVHGAHQAFTYVLPDTSMHTVELQVSDTTPFLLDMPLRSRRWTVNPGSLAAGWNLLGNGGSTTLDVAAAYGDAAKVNTVWKWIASASRWAFYAPSLTPQALADYAAGKAYDVLSTIKGGEAYWINAKVAFSAPAPAGTPITSASFRSMATGWNLIAIGDNKLPRAFNNALSATTPAADEIPANVTTLWAWDAALRNWYFYAPSLDLAGTLGNFTASKSYLDFGTKVLEPATGFWANKP